jgi:hypothetical protein
MCGRLGDWRGSALVCWVLPGVVPGNAPCTPSTSRLGVLGWSASPDGVALGGKWLPLVCWLLVVSGVLCGGREGCPPMCSVIILSGVSLRLAGVVALQLATMVVTCSLRASSVLPSVLEDATPSVLVCPMALQLVANGVISPLMRGEP